MDGRTALTIDMILQDINCLGSDVYAFWEIVNTERWWEYTVRPEVEERLRAMRETNSDMREAMSQPLRSNENLQAMMKNGHREGKGQAGEELAKTGDDGAIKSGDVKQKKRELKDTSDEDTKRRRTGLDHKLEFTMLANEGHPRIESMNLLSESTCAHLKEHDKSVTKQRESKLSNASIFKPQEFRELMRKFEISWERQRQDIINVDPNLRLAWRYNQAVAEGSSEASSMYEELQERSKENEERKLKEVSKDLEFIQEQLNIAIEVYPGSSFSMKHTEGQDSVYLECAFCPGADIRIKLKGYLDVIYRLGDHQGSKKHMDRYREVATNGRSEEARGDLGADD